MWLQKWQECLCNHIIKKVRFSITFSYFVRSSRRPIPRLHSVLRTEGRLFSVVLSCWCSSDFNVLLNAQLGQGLFNAQRCQAGSAVGIPTLPHDFAHDPQGLERHRIKGELVKRRHEYGLFSFKDTVPVKVFTESVKHNFVLQCVKEAFIE